MDSRAHSWPCRQVPPGFQLTPTYWHKNLSYEHVLTFGVSRRKCISTTIRVACSLCTVLTAVFSTKRSYYSTPGDKRPKSLPKIQNKIQRKSAKRKKWLYGLFRDVNWVEYFDFCKLTTALLYCSSVSSHSIEVILKIEMTNTHKIIW